MHKLLYFILLLTISGCSKQPSKVDSNYPIAYEGADSIKLIDSDLSFNGIHLGELLSFDSIKSPLRHIDTYYTQYNPEQNPAIPSFVTEKHSELDNYRDPDFKCKVFLGLNTNIVYTIAITINRRDTAMVNAYINKYGENNCIKWKENNWMWEFKNQKINMWLMDDYTSIEYIDSVNLKIHELEVDSIKKAYKDEILKYNKTLESVI